MAKTKEEYNAYMREYMRERYHRRRVQILERLGGKCKQCGNTDSLQIDHVDRTKKGFSIGVRLAGVAEAKLEQEIAKCQLLCKGCHEYKSVTDMGLRHAKGHHGTVSTYRWCKCEVCKAAAAQYNRELRARNKQSS